MVTRKDRHTGSAATLFAACWSGIASSAHNKSRILYRLDVGCCRSAQGTRTNRELMFGEWSTKSESAINGGDAIRATVNRSVWASPRSPGLRTLNR